MDKALSKYKNDIRLVIFDLDQTLVDWIGGEAHLFPCVRNILESLASNGFKIALATYNRWAEHFLTKLGVVSFFDMIETDIVNTLDKLDYKATMLQNILENFQIPPEKVLFFDDQKRNLETATRIGIHGVYVDYTGITEEDFMNAFKMIY